MSLCKIADTVFRLGPFAQTCGVEHSLKTEVFINLRPMDSCVRQVKSFNCSAVQQKDAATVRQNNSRPVRPLFRRRFFRPQSKLLKYNVSFLHNISEILFPFKLDYIGIFLYNTLNYRYFVLFESVVENHH